jgi:hypothetical protein
LMVIESTSGGRGLVGRPTARISSPSKNCRISSSVVPSGNPDTKTVRSSAASSAPVLPDLAVAVPAAAGLPAPLVAPGFFDAGVASFLAPGGPSFGVVQMGQEDLQAKQLLEHTAQRQSPARFSPEPPDGLSPDASGGGRG